MYLEPGVTLGTNHALCRTVSSTNPCIERRGTT